MQNLLNSNKPPGSARCERRMICVDTSVDTNPWAVHLGTVRLWRFNLKCRVNLRVWISHFRQFGMLPHGPARVHANFSLSSTSSVSVPAMQWVLVPSRGEFHEA